MIKALIKSNKSGSIIFWLAILVFQCNIKEEAGIIMTVNGPISKYEMKESLCHEHVLVDFVGADSTGDHRWDKSEVIKVVLPYLKQLRELGCKTFIDCTPAYLGRDPVLLKILSDSSGLNIITNTGYYGARNNKYLPPHAYNETADELAQRWISEWNDGINDTNIKPGFIKISVDSESDTLSYLHKKLVIAAAKTHLQTGLTIASHTGLANPAFEQLAILENEGVGPEAFIWVHSQAEKDYDNHIKAAQIGAWVSLDGLNDDNIEDYINLIKHFKRNNLLNKILLSHDAGWYSVGEQNGGDFKDYNTIIDTLIPSLKKENFTDEEIRQLIVYNPMNAYEIKVRIII